MSKAKELIEKLTELEITQDGSWDESIPEEIWVKEFDGKHDVLAEELDVDKHRWYETCITVVQFEDESIMGIRHVGDVFSESMSIGDCDWEMSFFPMIPVTTTTYVTSL